jgi:uncharacterized protein
MARQTFVLTDLVSEQNIPLGLDLPMNTSRGANFQMNYTTIKQARANLLNLLLTSKGERVMQPTFGCDLDKIVMEPLTDFLLDTVQTTIESAINTWLPYITIQELDVYRPDGKPNTLGISLTFSLLNNTIETESIELQITQ